MSNVLLIITASISGKLFYKLQEELEKENEVKILFTENALKLLHTDLDFYFSYKGRTDFVEKSETKKYEKICGKGEEYISYQKRRDKFSLCFPSITNISAGYEYEVYEYQKTRKIEHIDLINWADKCVIAPCTANTLCKLSKGITDNFVMSVLTAFLGTYKPLYIAPAMNYNMFNNYVVQRSINDLRLNSRTYFIYPTVKKLECGDFGIGGLADILTINNIVNGYLWNSPFCENNTIKYEERVIKDIEWGFREFNWFDYLPKYTEPGSFGSIRKYDIHTGVDIYCEEGTIINAVEEGEVIDVGIFTGNKVDSPWWNETEYIVIKGRSGYVLYGEIGDIKLSIGDHVISDEILGIVRPVLPKEKIREDIRNHNNFMLHMELYKEYLGKPIIWNLGENKDKNLIDPTPYLMNI